MRKIVPHLWFDTEAVEAAQFYCSVFPQSQISYQNQLHDTPSGTVDVVSLKIWNYDFDFISAGPYFTLNPTISFTVLCETEEEIDGIWSKLEDGGTALMPLDEYPFSKKYGWIKDRYGMTWQLTLLEQTMPKQRIVPAMMFTQENIGKAYEAMEFYCSVFHDSKIGNVIRYGEFETPQTDGKTQYADLQLEGENFSVLDSPYDHKFTFNEAISFQVMCDTQEEIDSYWEKLSAHPEAEQCGWLKDKYGLSWQIVPRRMREMMKSGTADQIARVTQAFLKMKKFDIQTLQNIYEQQ